MNISVISIGDELLLGNVVDTNTPFIARETDKIGGRIVYSCHVADDSDEIYAAIDNALGRSDVVITTGGLGPTKDDITKQVMCRYFGCGLRYDRDVAANVESIFRRRGIPMNKLTASQAMVPEDCQVIQNEVGTASVMWFEKDGKVLVSLPGVPREMCYMFVHGVLPRLVSRYCNPEIKIAHRFIVTEGISESSVNGQIDTLEEESPLKQVHIAYLPQSGYLKIRLDSTDVVMLEAAESDFISFFGSHVAYLGDMTPAEALLKRLRASGMTLSSAESCTGGNIAHQLTLIPGCSDVYQGSVVSYSNEVKRNVLGVRSDTLTAHGAVSLEVATEMALGVAATVGTDCSIATSGIAGPGGATPGKPVGTVCIAASCRGTVDVEECHFPGERSEVISRATNRGLLKLLRMI